MWIKGITMQIDLEIKYFNKFKQKQSFFIIKIHRKYASDTKTNDYKYSVFIIIVG